MDEHLTNGAQPGAETSPASGGTAAGSEGSNPSGDGSTLTLAEINDLLGKQYKDKATALKSLKDMSSMAGKAADLSGRKDDQEISTLKAEMEAIRLDSWFTKNPEHEPNRKILAALAKANNTTIEKAVELEEYQEISKRTSKPERRTVVDSKSRQQPSDTRNKDFEKAKKGEMDWGTFLRKNYIEKDA
jgi:hypothetical protein